MCPTGMLRRGMEPNIGKSSLKSHLKGLNSAIKVHVKDSVLIVPDSGRGTCYFVTDEEDSIVTRVRLHLANCGAGICPGLDSRLHAHRVTSLVKGEIGRAAADQKLLIGEIVKHVAFSRVRLAPGVLMRSDVGGFAIIRNARILSWDEVS